MRTGSNDSSHQSCKRKENVFLKASELSIVPLSTIECYGKGKVVPMLNELSTML
jgi:hypothetical protein